MSFFQKLFTLKRTKMIDDAAFFHKPLTIGKSILTFFVSLIIANLLTGLIQSIPLMVYLLGQTDISTAGGTDLDKYMEQLEQAISSIPEWIVGLELFASAMFFAVAVYVCKRREQRDITTMGIRKNDCVPEFLVGYIMGFALLALPVLLSVAFGTARVSFSSFSPIIILFFFGFLVEGFSKEAFARGYFMTSLARDYSPMVAVFVSSVAFSLLSATANFDFIYLINSILLGLLLGFYVFKRGSIIGATAIHAGFTFTRKCIFGRNEISLFYMEPSSKSTILSGGSSGIDSGLCLTVVLVIAIFLVLLTSPKQAELSEFESTKCE